jgi:hypothetical protein
LIRLFHLRKKNLRRKIRGIRKVRKKLINESVPKLQFLEQKLMKTAVLQSVGRKTARACYKITDFGTGSTYNGGDT